MTMTETNQSARTFQHHYQNKLYTTKRPIGLSQSQGNSMKFQGKCKAKESNLSVSPGVRIPTQTTQRGDGTGRDFQVTQINGGLSGGWESLKSLENRIMSQGCRVNNGEQYFILPNERSKLMLKKQARKVTRSVDRLFYADPRSGAVTPRKNSTESNNNPRTMKRSQSADMLRSDRFKLESPVKMRGPVGDMREFEQKGAANPVQNEFRERVASDPVLREDINSLKAFQLQEAKHRECWSKTQENLRHIRDVKRQIK